MNDVALFIAWLAFVLVMYFLPTMVAQHRGREGWAMIALANLLLGWTVVVWLVLLVVAFTGESRQAREQREHMLRALAQR